MDEKNIVLYNRTPYRSYPYSRHNNICHKILLIKYLGIWHKFYTYYQRGKTYYLTGKMN